VSATLADRLNAAADIIEERGHAHGTLEDNKGHVCLVGALRSAVTGSATSGLWASSSGKQAEFEDAKAAVAAVIENHAERNLTYRIFDWNDATRKGRFVHGKRDAVRLLRKAARKAAGQ
jgi:hypothetical protein